MISLWCRCYQAFPFFKSIFFCCSPKRYSGSLFVCLALSKSLPGLSSFTFQQISLFLGALLGHFCSSHLFLLIGVIASLPQLSMMCHPSLSLHPSSPLGSPHPPAKHWLNSFTNHTIDTKKVSPFQNWTQHFPKSPFPGIYAPCFLHIMLFPTQSPKAETTRPF